MKPMDLMSISLVAILVATLAVIAACSSESENGDDRADNTINDDDQDDDDAHDDVDDDDVDDDDDTVPPPPCGPEIEPLVEGRVIGDADIAALADGSIALVWTERVSFDLRVVVRICAADATGQYGPVDIQDDIANPAEASAPEVAATPDGGFVIAYLARSDASLHIAARWFDGEAQPTTPIVEIADVVDPDADPAVAVDPATGDTLIAWGARTGASEDHQLSGRVLDASGNAMSDVFEIASVHALSWQSPRAAASPSGDFVVTWSGITTTVGDDNDRKDEPSDPAAVWVASIDHNGNVVIGPMEPDVASLGSSAFPSVARVASGVAFGWSTGSEGSSVAYADLLSTELAPTWTESAVLSDSFDGNGPVTVTALDDETFLALWYTTTYGADDAETHSLDAAVFRSNGDRLADLQILGHDATSFDAGYRMAPFGAGGFVVAARVHVDDDPMADLTLIHCVWDGEPGCTPEL